MHTRVLVLALSLFTFAAHAELQAGAAKVSIVPPVPTPMGGFFDRIENFKGVQTPVYARTLVTQEGDVFQALVVLDLIGVSSELVEAARMQVQQETGIASERIMISATHDHSAPSGFVGMSLAGESDQQQALTDFLIAQIVTSVKEAKTSARSASLGFAYGHVEGMTRNRQQNNLETVDPEVGVLLVQEKGTRKTIATLCNFTGHPVILGSNNLDLSSEYPGRVCQVVEDVLGGTALFTQGACGDITMQRSGDPLEEIKRIGNAVAGEVIKTASLVKPGEETALQSFYQPVKVEPRSVPPVDEAERLKKEADAALEAGNASKAPANTLQRLERAADAAGTTLMVARLEQQRPGLLEQNSLACVQVMQWGPLVMIGIPGEMFVEYGLEMKQRVRQTVDRDAIIVGYANDYIGYIVTPRAVATGGYEQAIARVSSTAGRTLVEAAMGLVEEHIKTP